MITISKLQQDVVESIIDMMILLRMPCPCCGGHQEGRQDTSGHTVECSLGAIQFDRLVKSIGNPPSDNMAVNPFVVDAFWRWGAQLAEMEANIAQDVTPPEPPPAFSIRQAYRSLFGR